MLFHLRNRGVGRMRTSQHERDDDAFPLGGRRFHHRDVNFGKTSLILGQELGQDFANRLRLPTIFSFPAFIRQRADTIFHDLPSLNLP